MAQNQQIAKEFQAATMSVHAFRQAVISMYGSGGTEIADSYYHAIELNELDALLNREMQRGRTDFSDVDAHSFIDCILYADENHALFIGELLANLELDKLTDDGRGVFEAAVKEGIKETETLTRVGAWFECADGSITDARFTAVMSYVKRAAPAVYETVMHGAAYDDAEDEACDSCILTELEGRYMHRMDEAGDAVSYSELGEFADAVRAALDKAGPCYQRAWVNADGTTSGSRIDAVLTHVAAHSEHFADAFSVAQ